MLFLCSWLGFLHPMMTRPCCIGQLMASASRSLVDSVFQQAKMFRPSAEYTCRITVLIYAVNAILLFMETTRMGTRGDRQGETAPPLCKSGVRETIIWFRRNFSLLSTWVRSRLPKNSASRGGGERLLEDPTTLELVSA